MKRYCDECGKDTETKIVNKKEVYKVYGTEIEVDTQVMVCKVCGEELFNEELDSATLTKVYNEYRKRKNLLFPAEIKNIREKYGMSQRGFSKLLNWGDKTIARYENGSVQDNAHNSLLVILSNPENMKEYLHLNKDSIDPKQSEKIYRKIEQLESEGEYSPGNRLINLFFSQKPDINNGFKTFDYKKFSAMVIFFAQNNKELLKTKLMKLLNYSDMLFFKENSVSISGLRYVHFPYGPVPENFDMLLGKLAADKIAYIEIVYDSVYEKHQIILNSDSGLNILTDKEIEILTKVNNKFSGFGSREISDYSHKEIGYQKTLKGEIISYFYAGDIEL